MKIILLQDVKKVGKKDQVLEVSDGYANNFLIKNKMAIQYTHGSIERLEKEIDTRGKKEEQLIKDMEKLKQKLEKDTILFQVAVGKEDKMFGKISSKQIKEELDKMGYSIEKNIIDIKVPIDYLGFHNVNINLHKKVVAKVKISVEKK